MKRNRIGLLFGLCLLCSGMLRAADSDAIKNCIATWTAACAKDCATAKCVSNCTTQAHDACAKNIVSPQLVFSGPVVATPTDQCIPPDSPLACTPGLLIDPIAPAATSCSVISGTVTDPKFWGGQVTIYVICPPASPFGRQNGTTTTTVIGEAASSCTDGKFTMTATNSCSGETGCYGLIAVTPPTSCEACGTCSGTPSHDPAWSSCTGAVCPNP